jgi:hypothetical protein
MSHVVKVEQSSLMIQICTKESFKPFSMGCLQVRQIDLRQGNIDIGVWIT